MTKILGILALGAFFLCSVAVGQNRAPVEVRKTDHTLVWPLDFFEQNQLMKISTNYVRVNVPYSISTNSQVMQSGTTFTFSIGGTNYPGL